MQVASPRDTDLFMQHLLNDPAQFGVSSADAAEIAAQLKLFLDQGGPGQMTHQVQMAGALTDKLNQVGRAAYQVNPRNAQLVAAAVQGAGLDLSRKRPGG